MPISLIGPTGAVHPALPAAAATGADRMPTRLPTRMTQSPKHPTP